MTTLLDRFNAISSSDLVEARTPSDTVVYRDETVGKIERVVATLKRKDSAKYTTLAKKLNEIERLQKEIKQLQSDVKADTKQYIVDLFDAEDACKTRVVETVSVILVLSKDPKPSESVQYAKVLAELENHLTPELIKVLNKLKEQFVSVTQKSPSLTISGQIPESVQLSESWMSDLAQRMKVFASRVLKWAVSYDRKLNRIKAQLGITS